MEALFYCVLDIILYTILWAMLLTPYICVSATENIIIRAKFVATPNTSPAFICVGV